MQEWKLPPGEIEQRSFAIIDAEATAHDWDPAAWSIVRRMIHTTGDFEFVQSVRMHPQAIERGTAALKSGCVIFTDTKMAMSGISAPRLAPFGAKVRCLISHPDVAARAEEEGITRAMAAVDAALEMMEDGIYAVGNAPTALFRVLEHIEAGRAKPALVVGIPVGFVNAVESKEALAASGVPHITALGRKGGSALAAAVINALTVLSKEGTSNE